MPSGSCARATSTLRLLDKLVRIEGPLEGEAATISEMGTLAAQRIADVRAWIGQATSP